MIEAIYENGVYRPLQPVSDPEGTRVRIYNIEDTNGESVPPTRPSYLDDDEPLSTIVQMPITDAASLQAWLDALDALPKIELTPEDEAAMREAWKKETPEQIEAYARKISKLFEGI